MDSEMPAFMSDAPGPVSPSLRGLSPQALTHLGGGRFIAWRLRRPFLGECRRGLVIFMLTRRVLATTLHLNPRKTRPCATLALSVGRTKNTDTCVCKINGKCNIASLYCVWFLTQYSASDDNEANLNVAKMNSLTEHYKSTKKNDIMCIYIYIYIERERESHSPSDFKSRRPLWSCTHTHTHTHTHTTHTYIYIYIYIYPKTKRLTTSH